MHNLRKQALLLLPLALLLCGMLKAQPKWSANDTQVNTTTANDQTRPAAAQAGNGQHVVVWESFAQDGDGFGIFGQVYDSAGNVTVSEFQVNTDVTSSQRMPDVAMADDGRFVVAWMDDIQDGDGWGVYFQRYTAAGASSGSETRFNSTSTGNQMMPKVGMDYDGNIYLTWMAENEDGDGFAVMHRRYNNSGAAQMSETVANDTTVGHQSQPDIAVDSAGNYIVVWQSENTDGDGQGVFAKIYDNTSNVLVGQFQVNTTTAGNQQAPSVAADKNGNFVVSWSSYDSGNGVYQIYHRRYNISGTALSGEVLTGGSPSINQDHSDVAMTQEGQYAISWSSYGQDGSYEGVYLQPYLASGTAMGTESIVNTTTTNFQQHSGSAWRRDSLSLIMSWQSGFYGSTSTQDGDDYGIFVRSAAVADTTDPTAVCQNISVYLDNSGNASITAVDVDGGSSDNVGIASLSVNTSAFTCSDLGSNVVILTVTDSSANTASCNATVTVLDSVSPTAVCQNLTVYLDGSGSATITGADLDGGSSDNCAVSSTSASQTTFACSDAGTVSVTLTASDASGNTGTCTSTVTVLDSVTPTAVCQNLTVHLDGSGSATVTGADLDGGSSDNCSLTASASPSSFNCANIGSNSSTLTVTDNGGNSATCTSTVTVSDTTSPTAVCQTTTVYLDGSGSGSLSAGDVDGGSSDNCSVSSSSVNLSSFACADIGSNTVTLTVNDANGNSSTCNASVVVSDTVSPTATCSNLTVYLNGTGNASITTGDVDGGSTDNCAVSSLALSQSAFTCSDIGATSVTLTASDASANAGSCTATVTVIDSVSPTASCQNISVYLDGSGAASITSGDIDNGSTDNCSSVSSSLNVSSFNCNNLGSNTVTLTATDGSSNTSSCTSTVTVVDSTSPTASCQNVTLFLDGSGSASLTAADADGGSTDNCSITSSSVNTTSFACSDAGTTSSVTLTLTDQSGNSSACTSQVTVTDSTSPTPVCQNITVFLGATGTASITAADVDGGSTDNCSVSGISVGTSSFDCSNVGANTVVLTAEDPSANTSSCSAIVTIEDTTSPAAVCQDLTLYLNAIGQANISASDVNNGSSDNCAISNVTVSATAFDCNNLGNNTVVLTVTDTRSNLSTCTANITVLDTISPTAVCNTTTVYLDAAGTATFTLADADGGSSDNCAITNSIFSTQNYDCSDVGQTFTLPLLLSDASSNTSSCSAVVTIADSTSPSMSCTGLTLFLDSNGSVSISTSDIDAGSTDNCSIATLTLDSTSFDCNEVGSNTVTLTGLDVNGNTNTCTGVVTVIDTTRPTVACQNTTVYLDASGSVTITGNDVTSVNSDNCSISSVFLSTSTFSCADLGTTTVTVISSDPSNNFTSCTSDVTVLDTTAPTAICNAITAYLDASGSVTVTVSDVDGGSSDNCAIDSVAFTNVTYTCTDVGGPYALTLENFDASLNSNSCLASVIVADTSAPVATCQNLTVFLDATGSFNLQPSDVATTTDNCTITETVSPSSFTCADVGVVTVSYSATDPGGLVDSCTSSLVIADTTSPTLVCQDITVFLNSSGTATISTSDLDNGSSDNCGSVVLILTQTNLGCADVGTNNFTLLGQDSNNNLGSCTSLVTVQDTFAPTAVCQPFTVYLDGTGTAFSDGSAGDGGSTDNCGIDTTFLGVSNFSCADIGTVNTNLTVLDVDGNFSTCNVTLTVADTLAPVAVCANPNVYLDATGTVTVQASDVDGGSSDNCGITSSSLGAATFTCSDLGAQNVTLTLADSVGNTSSCTSTVTVVDSTAPVATCQNVTVNLDGNGEGSLNVSDVGSSTGDNCGVASLTISVDSFFCADLGINTVFLVALDSSGNADSCSAQVSVEDPIPPVAQCTGTTVTLDANGVGSIVPSDIDFASADNCGIDSMALSNDSFDCTNLGINTVTLTVFDASGNSDQCNGNVFVEDVDLPTAVCANPTLYVGPSGTVSLTGGVLDGGSTDNCGIDSIAFPPTTYTCGDLGTHQLIVTFFDQSGNGQNCTSTITVEDTLPPMVVCVPDTVYLDTTGTASITVANVDGGSGDNCGLDAASGTVSPSTFTASDIGQNTVTLSFDDVNGNSDSCQATVTVLDTLIDAISDLNLWLGQFDVWPNPTPGQFNVELSGVEGLMGEDVRFELTDLSGKVLVSDLGKYGLEGIKRSFDLSQYAKGSYILRVRVDGKLLTRKLVKY